MLTSLSDWLRRRRDDRAAAKAEAERAEHAVALARAASASCHPERQTLNGHKIDAVEDGHIVTLLHVGATLPPERSWWHVDGSGAVSELSYDKAAMRIDMPIWR